MTDCKAFRLTPICSALLAVFAATALHANPRNPAVASGQATFTEQGKVLTVKNTPGAIINWQQFSIGTGETTRFIQQTAASSVLNRVTGQDPSKILGTLQSNGRVFIVNPNGIVFGQGSKIDVASLIASTLNISDANFLSGKYLFEAGSAGAGAIQNLGTLNAGDKGNIYLIAPQIENSGIINAPNGQILLAAGRTVQLVDIGNPHLRIEVAAPDDKALNLGNILAQGGEIGLYGSKLVNRGRISADSAVQGPGGKILFKASGSGVTLEEGSQLSANGASGGTITVQSPAGDTLAYGATLTATGSAGKGGNITLEAERVGLAGATTIDASGSTGGGNILVGGDYQGKNAAVQNARSTFVGSEVKLAADATAKGDGGRIIVWSDHTTRAYGQESVRGGPQGGNGGLVELSGKQSLDFRPTVDLAAPNGQAGTLLLDPNDIAIAGGSGSGAFTTQSGTINFADSTGEPTTVYEQELENFASGTIILHATNSVAMTGSSTAFTSTELRLQPGVNLDIATAGGTGDITLNLVPIFTQGGTATISATGSTGILRAGSIDTGNGSISLTANDVRLSGTLLSAGNINITATGPNGIRQDPAETMPFNLNTAGAGSTITLEADRVEFLGAYGGYSTQTAANSTLWIKPYTSGKQIKFGINSSTQDGNLNIGQSDIDRLTPASSSSTLKIGSTAAGDLTIATDLQITDPDIATLHLISGGNIDNGSAYYLQGFNASPVSNLIAQATGNVTLLDADNYFNTIAGQAGGAYRFSQNSPFAVAATGVTAGTKFELRTLLTSSDLTLNGIATGSSSPADLSFLQAGQALIQGGAGGIAGNRVELRADSGDVDFDNGATLNSVTTLTGYSSGSSFLYKQQSGFSANSIGVAFNPDNIDIRSVVGSLSINQIVSDGNILAYAGGAGGLNVGPGGISLGAALTSSIDLQAPNGPIAIAAAASVLNSSPSGSIKMRSAGNISLGAGSLVSSSAVGSIDIATGAAGSISGSAATLEADELMMLAGSGINVRTRDVTKLSAKNTGSNDLSITDTTVDPANVTSNPLKVVDNTNADSVALNGLENLASGGKVIVKSERPIRVEAISANMGVTANASVELESKTQNAGDSLIELSPSMGNLTVSAPDVKLRANDFGFYSGSGTLSVTGTGTTGFVSLSPATSGGSIEIWDGDPVGGATLEIEKSLFSKITSPYIGIGSSDALSLSGSLLVSGALSTADFNAGFLGLGLMAGSGTISQSAGATLTLPTLITRGAGSVNLTETNLVSKYIANHTGSASVSFRNAQNLDIGRIVPAIGATLEGITTDGGNITLNVTGNLTASDTSTGSRKEIDAGAGNVTLTATGNMALRRVEGTQIQMTSGGNIIGFIAGAPAAIKADTLTASAGGSTGILLDTNVNKLNASASAATANINITEANDIAVGVISATGDVKITAGGAITDDNAAGANNISANRLFAKATAINLDSSLGQFASLEATTAGAVSLRDTGTAGSALGLDVIADNSLVTLTATRSIRGATAGSRAIIDADTLNISSSGSGGLFLDTAVNRINASATAAGAGIDIIEGDDIGIGTLSATNVRIHAGGNILDENGTGTLNVTAQQLDAKGNSVSLDTRILDSARIEGTGTNNTNIVWLNDLAPQTALATPLQVIAISAGNPIEIAAQRSLRVNASGPAGGNIRVATTNTAGQPGSDIHAGLIQTAGGTIQMIAGGAIIDDNDTAAAGAVLNIDAANLDMKAETGIGADNPLEIKVSKLAIENKTGTVALANTGGPLEVTKADLGQTGPSDLKISTDGPLTVSGPVRTTAGNIDLVASGDIQQNADIITGSAGSILVKSTGGALRMAAGTSTTSNGGTIDCDAEGDVILSQLSTGSTGSVAVRTKTGSIGSSSTGNNITTGSMLLAAAKGISGVGFTSKTASVSSTSGFITLTNTSTGAVISNDPALNPPEELVEEEEKAVEQTLSESVLAAINTLTPTTGENPNLLPESDAKKKEEEEAAKKANEDGSKESGDGTTKKAGLPVCGK